MIVLYGTVCLDRIRTVGRFPQKGGYEEILGQVELLGGEAANSAMALAKWGAEVKLASIAIGRGVGEQLILDKLRSGGVGTEGVASSDEETPFCDVYVTPDGERTMFGRGFRAMESRADLSMIPLVEGAWFTADPNHGAAAREATCRALKAGMKIYLLDFLRDDDPITAGSFWQSSTDWAGKRGNTQLNIKWLQAWIDKFRCTAILSDGPNGFVAGSPQEPVRAYPPYPCVNLVDSTGAGDIFRAGMLFGLDLGWPLADCFRFASAAGCLKCGGLGATSLIPSRAEVEALIYNTASVSVHYA